MRSTATTLRLPLGLALPTALALPVLLSLAAAVGAQPRPPLPVSIEDATMGAPPAPATGFADVGATHWAAPAIRRVVEAGVLEGYGGKFHGERNVDRYQMAAILDRLLAVQGRQTERLLAEVVVPPPVAEADPGLSRELAETRRMLAATQRTMLEQEETLVAVRAMFRPSRFKPW